MKYNFDFEKGSRNNPFSVPEGYFDDFCKKIDVLTSQEQVNTVPLFKQKKFYAYLAAAVLVVAVFAGVFLFDNSGRNVGKNPVYSQNHDVEYNEVINNVIEEDASEDFIVDYILANTD